MTTTLRDLPTRWRAQAGELRVYAPGVAAAFERAAADLDRELRNLQRQERERPKPKLRGKSVEAFTRDMIRAKQKKQ